MNLYQFFILINNLIFSENSQYLFSFLLFKICLGISACQQHDIYIVSLKNVFIG